MRAFKTKWFVRFARKERITDEALWDAVERAEHGQIDADLGGGVIKQRVARRGQGKSGGYRTVVAYRTAERAIFAFAFGFAKSAKASLDANELIVYQRLASVYLAMSDLEVAASLTQGMLTEMTSDGEED